MPFFVAFYSMLVQTYRKKNEKKKTREKRAPKPPKPSKDCYDVDVLFTWILQGFEIWAL